MRRLASGSSSLSCLRSWPPRGSCNISMKRNASVRMTRSPWCAGDELRASRIGVGQDAPRSPPCVVASPGPSPHTTGRGAYAIRALPDLCVNRIGVSRAPGGRVCSRAKHRRRIRTWQQMRPKSCNSNTWSLNRSRRGATLSSIGSGLSIVGNIECNGPAQVFGRIKGEVRASDLLIGDGAQIEGSVIAQDVTVCGRVKGTIRAVRVKLQDSGAVEGDIFHRSLSIDENSLFEGSSRRVENPTDLPSVEAK